MGTITSKDTRRISFANTCALTTPIVIQNSIEVENAIAFNELPAEPSNELLFKEKYSNLTEEGDGDYWSHRMDYLKKEHQEINKIIESEYDKKIEAANVTSESPKILHDKLQKVKPCFDWRAKIYEITPESFAFARNNFLSTCFNVWLRSIEYNRFLIFLNYSFMKIISTENRQINYSLFKDLKEIMWNKMIKK